MHASRATKPLMSWTIQWPDWLDRTLRAFGFVSLDHNGSAAGADEQGLEGACFSVHRLARWTASPMRLLSAAAARTERLEADTDVTGASSSTSEI